MYLSPGIVFGFHGCDQKVYDRVVKNGKHLTASENSHDWLGSGIYFWEGSYQRALEWAKDSKSIKKPAVVGAVIKLGNCVDLLDAEYLAQAKDAYQLLKEEFETLEKPLPQNKAVVDDISFVRELDCQVMMRMQQMNNELIAEALETDDKKAIQNHPDFIDSVRGMFPEGEPLYENAGFRSKNHIQLCIVNPNAIIGYFDPKKRRNPNYKAV